MVNSRVHWWEVCLLYLLYLSALITGLIVLPLWLPEILHLAGTADPNVNKLYDFIGVSPKSPQLTQLFTWCAASPGESPLGCLAQLPFSTVFGSSSRAARLPSILLACLNVLLFWRLTQRTSLRNQVVAMVLFAAVPIHYHVAVEASAFELSLTAVLVSALFFLRVIESPDVPNTVLYGIALVFCLYSMPRSVIPGFGFALCTLAFTQNKDVRKALWHLLPATVGAALLYLPYFRWAHQHHLVHDQVPLMPLVPSDHYWLNDTDWPMVFRDVTGGGNAGYALTCILSIGIGIGVWRAYRYSTASQVKRLALFCLFGGSLVSLIINLTVDVASNDPFEPSQLLWSLPGFMILFTAGLDWLESKSRFAAWPAAAVFFVFCIAGNYTFLTSRSENIKGIAEAALPELTPNSCVVFVSERLSPLLFRTLEPKLSPVECRNFFHPRIVMVVHPYVEPSQQKNAEVYFRGLDFHEVKRLRTGGGEVIVIEGQQ